MSTDYLALLKAQFNDQVEMKEKRPGVFQLLLPAFLDDGDMAQVFLEPIVKDGEEWIRISDHAMTVMHLFSFDLEVPDNERMFLKVVARKGICQNDGVLFLDVKKDELLLGVLHFVQALTVVSNLEMDE